MRPKYLSLLMLSLAILIHVPRAAAFDWDPITDAEKSMKSNPLDPGAGAVVLFKRGRIEVLEKQSLSWTTRIVTYERIKIFHDAGRDAADIKLDAYKYQRLSKVEGRTILPSGEIIPLDSSKVFRGKTYEEGKNFAIIQTSFSFPSVQPGAIVEYQIEETQDWFYPSPWIFDTRGLGTLDSSLSVLIGPRLGMAQMPLDTTMNKIAATRTDTVQGTQFTFSVKNLHPIVREPFAVPFYDQAATVLFNPTELVFSGLSYPLIQKWDDVAARLTESNNMEKSEKEAKNRVKDLTDKVADPHQKAQAIYKYIQQNITSSDVVGVLLGETADDVLTAKRGDPDEINALYVTMLKEAKIEADMVLVATQNWQTLVRAFPNRSQFSRIITRVNFKDGAVFADPADAAAPFGELPWFDRGVQGLAVKGTKIQEADIPLGTPDDNVSTTNATLKVAKDWTTEGDSQLALKGTEAIDFRDDLLEESPEQLDQYLTDYFSFGSSDTEVTNLVYPDLKDSTQPFVLKAHLKSKLNNEGGPSGFLLNPWLDDQFERPLFKASVRHSAVRFNSPEKRTSTSSWQLAPEIKVEQLPKDEKIDSDLGGFTHSCSQSGSTVTCTRTYFLKKTLLQTSAEYLNARKFFDDIAKADQEVMVLREQ
jgi:hypothetical protein